MRLPPTSALLALMLAMPMAAARDLRSTLDLRVSEAPHLARIGPARALRYELQLVNLAEAPITIDAIEVLDAGRTSTLLARWQGDRVADRIMLSATTRDATPTRTLPPGRHALAYLDLELAPRVSTPRRVEHRLSLRIDGRTVELRGGAAPVETRARTALGAPVRGGPWIAIHLPEAPRGHRRVAFALDGALRIPARFAIDWVKLDDDGHAARGDDRLVGNWYGHGADVLAVADARIVATRDDMREALSVEPVRNPLANASGNFVTLDLGDGRHFHYEHLLPGSVRVRAGDRVRRGEVIARLGNTGDTTGPHLHTHASDGARPLDGEGMPFEIERYERLGGYDSIADFGAGQRWKPASATPRIERARMPEPNSVIRFDPAQRD
ncbi:MAG: M23 family metallopeptidase [Lysobacteraceae bacterium]|nr:MAG: M23 family metallopeptidase [Xanthomonadaceae bacterium]